MGGKVSFKWLSPQWVDQTLAQGGYPAGVCHTLLGKDTVVSSPKHQFFLTLLLRLLTACGCLLSPDWSQSNPPANLIRQSQHPLSATDLFMGWSSSGREAYKAACQGTPVKVTLILKLCWHLFLSCWRLLCVGVVPRVVVTPWQPWRPQLEHCQEHDHDLQVMIALWCHWLNQTHRLCTSEPLIAVCLFTFLLKTYLCER